MNIKEKTDSKAEKKFSPNKKKLTIIIILTIILILIVTISLLIIKNREKNEKQETEISLISDNNNLTENTNIENILNNINEEEQSTSNNESNTANDATSSITVPSSSIQKTGYEPLDNLISSILDSITSSNASATTRLRAIYNYVKSNMTYTYNAQVEDNLFEKIISLGYSKYDAEQMTLAYNAAKYKQGVCDNYAALTMILARASGIKVWQCGGISSKNSSHAWNIIYINDEKYLIDTNYSIFMQPFSSAGYKEQMNGSNYFNNFKTSKPVEEEKKISWMFNAGWGDNRYMGNNRGTVTKTATIDRAMYSDEGAIYPAPICPIVKVEGNNNTFTATVSSGGNVIETLSSKSGTDQNYYFSWYPKQPGSYIIEIIAKSDNVFEGHFIMYVNLT